MYSFVKTSVKKTSAIVFMDIVWAAYLFISNWVVDYLDSPFVAGMFLRGAAFVFLTVFLLCKKEFLELFKQGKVTWILLLIGVLGFTTDLFANIGFKYGNLSTGSVLLKTDIIMTNIITVVIFKHKLHAKEWIGSLIMLAGVILVLGVGSKNFSFNWYDLFFIASAISVTVDAFIIKHAKNEYHVKSDMIAYYNNLVVLVLFTLATFISGDFRILGQVKLNYIFYILFAVGGLAQTCIYIFYYYNLDRMHVWQVKLALLVIPVISLILGVLVDHEKVTWLQGLGIGIMLIGAVIVVIHVKTKKHEKVLKHTEWGISNVPNEGEPQHIDELKTDENTVEEDTENKDVKEDNNL